MRTASLATVILATFVGIGPAQADFATADSLDGNSNGSSSHRFTYVDPYGTSAFGTLETVSSGLSDGSEFAIGGSLTLSSSADGLGSLGTYSLISAGPNVTLSPSGMFLVDNLIFPGNDAANGSNPGIWANSSYLTLYGLLFGKPGTGSQDEINIWGNGSGDYALWSQVGGRYNLAESTGGVFELALNADRTSIPEPGGFILFGLGLASMAGAGYHWRRQSA